ncbi:GLPGLI family protein [Cellulophaga baltica]|uniref:GLPGLI family protein n=1 Tax=Cellulophaga baltica TaxID=76594 RepID=UPI000423AB04|nr:GLPGLI family protein [Cellulophaga baltica]
MKFYSSVIIIILLIMSNYCYGQKKSGQVIFRVESLESSHDTIPLDSDYGSFKREINKAAKELKFSLLFDQNKSVFGLVKFLPQDLNMMYVKSAIDILGGNSTYYTDIKEKVLLEEMDFLGKDFLISTSFSKMNWQLTNESKYIENYLCFKAVGFRVATDKNFENKKILIEAWYCPGLPLNFGPFEAVGLPGLVLELKLTSFIFVASKISFKDDIILKGPPEDKSITKEEFDSFINEIAKKRI